MIFYFYDDANSKKKISNLEMYKDLMSTFFQKDYTDGFIFDYDNSLDFSNNRSYERNDKSNAQSNIVA